MEIKSFFEAQIERNKQLIIDSNLSEYNISFHQLDDLFLYVTLNIF